MKRKVFPVSMAVLWGIVFSQAMQSVTLDVCTNTLEHILETAWLILVKEHKLYYTAYIGLFPYHPVSEMRRFVRFIVENN